MTLITTIDFHGVSYEVTLSKPRILKIKKVFKDSGIEREVKFESLPKTVQKQIEESLRE